MSNIGMMDPAFFVGKNELLTWLNDLLEMNYSKVEQCANGAAYCQIMDAIYPVWMQNFSYSLMHLLVVHITHTSVPHGARSSSHDGDGSINYATTSMASQANASTAAGEQQWTLIMHRPRPWAAHLLL